MRKWTKTAGLLFLAAASVYSSQVIVAAVEGRATPTIQASAKVTTASNRTDVVRGKEHGVRIGSAVVDYAKADAAP